MTLRTTRPVRPEIGRHYHNTRGLQRRFTNPRNILSLAILLFSFASPAISHPDIQLRIAAISERIAADPGNANLYLRRGELHREHRDWDAALADYALAAKHQPQLVAVHLARGLMFFDAGRNAEAAAELDLFLAEEPASVTGRTARARVHVALGDSLGAADDYDLAIARSSRTTPEIYLERARALAEGNDDHLERALRGLDEGVAKLGKIVSLQFYASELEVRRGRYEAGIRRLDEIANSLPRERVLFRKGVIYQAAGKYSEAATAYKAAIDTADALPDSRRYSPPVVEFRAKLVTAWESVRGGKTDPTATGR